MHDIEPYYQWKELYDSAEDEFCPFYGKEYEISQFTNRVYNYYIHPFWDEIGSETLFVKLQYADYEEGYCILELIGEWNDCIHNDIMYLKRNVADPLIRRGVNKFILLCDHVFNFHGSDDCYYEEWKEDVEEAFGYVVFVNIQNHLLSEFKQYGIQFQAMMGDHFQDLNWRKLSPQTLFEYIQTHA